MIADFAPVILAELKEHRGLENAVTAPQLAVLVGLNERDVRKIIAREIAQWAQSEWRHCGLLLSRPGHGFFFATEAEDVAHRLYGFMRDQINAALKVADFKKAMRASGFGGLVTETIPKTFTDESHPEKRRTA